MTEKHSSGLAAFDPAVIEAFVVANHTAMKGFEKLSKYFFETARQNFDTAVETSRRLASVKSLAELSELQTKLSQEFFNTVSDRNKVAADLGATFMNDVTAAQTVRTEGDAGPVVRRAPGARAA